MLQAASSTLQCHLQTAAVQSRALSGVFVCRCQPEPKAELTAHSSAVQTASACGVDSTTKKSTSMSRACTLRQACGAMGSQLPRQTLLRSNRDEPDQAWPGAANSVVTAQAENHWPVNIRNLFFHHKQPIHTGGHSVRCRQHDATDASNCRFRERATSVLSSKHKRQRYSYSGLCPSATPNSSLCRERAAGSTRSRSSRCSLDANVAPSAGLSACLLVNVYICYTSCQSAFVSWVGGAP